MFCLSCTNNEVKVNWRSAMKILHTTCLILLALMFGYSVSNAAWVDSAYNPIGSGNVVTWTAKSFFPSLAYNSSGAPHIAWAEKISNTNYDIFYVEWNGSAWVALNNINVSGNIGKSGYLVGDWGGPSLGLDSSGNPAIAWFDNSNDSNYEIYYLHWNGSAWVDADGSGQESARVTYNPGISVYPSLKIDTTGNPHIAWIDNTLGSVAVYYLEWNGSAWVDSTGGGTLTAKVSTMQASTLHPPSLDLDNANKPGISWDNGVDIFYLKFNGTAWVDFDGVSNESIIVPQDSQASFHPSLSFGNTNKPHIAWSDNSGGGGLSHIYYLKSTDALSWVDVTGSGTGSIDITSSSYFDGAKISSLVFDKNTGLENVAFMLADDIYFKKWSGTTWVNAANNVGYSELGVVGASNPVLQMDDSTNNPGIAWQGSDGIYFKKWIAETPTFSMTPTTTNSPTITPTFTITPTPILLEVIKSATGNYTKIGDVIEFTIKLQNNSLSEVSDIVIWDTLTDELRFLSSDIPATIAPGSNGHNLLVWSLGSSTISSGDNKILRFKTEIVKFRDAKCPIKNTAAVDYKYDNILQPTVLSNALYYPEDMPAVFPNPFNISTAVNNRMKFDNLKLGSTITIYTVAGNFVTSIGPVDNVLAYWYGKNKSGELIQPGVYFYVIKSPGISKPYKGSIFVIARWVN